MTSTLAASNGATSPGGSAESAGTGVSDAQLSERFGPLLALIAEGALDRERQRQPLNEQVRLLVEAGFTALRVPVEFGGIGATNRQLFGLLVDLAAAESNLPQALRVHWNFVEDRLLAGDEEWLRAIADGTVVGNAITEPGIGAADRYRTALTRRGDGWVLNGTKYYSTGSLYADHILVAADQDGERVAVIVAADAPGVSQVDDWDGFGQRLTVSGTTEFVDVAVSEENILGPGYGVPGRTWATGYLQLVQLSVLAGIAQRALDDTVAWVRDRTRTFTHAAADLPRHDPLVQQVIGKLSAAAYGARALVLAVADDLDRILPQDAEDPVALDRFEADAGRAQSVVIGLVLDATTELFEVGGASISSAAYGLDRHWRNARTISAHNPLIFKQRSIGAHLLNDDPLPYQWNAGRRPVPGPGSDSDTPTDTPAA